VSASDNESGSVLILVLVFAAISSALLFFALRNVQSSIQYELSTSIRREANEWALSVSKRIHCERVMPPYLISNLCPPGTARAIIFGGEGPLATSGPDGSSPLGHDWYGKLSCGTGDLELKVAYYKSAFTVDPLSGKTLDFSHPASKVTDRPNAPTLCPSYFGSGKPMARMITMSILTQQYLSTTTDPRGNWTSIATTCDNKFGAIALVNGPAPFATEVRAGGNVAGNPNIRSNFGQYLYDVYRPYYDNLGWTGPMQPTWQIDPRYGRKYGTIMCNRICRSSVVGMQSGRMTRCDPTISAGWPAFGQVAFDADSSQVNCLCLN